jgi:hypothetical protein
MTMISCSLSALTVALLFYSWRDYFDRINQRQRMLRARVTYLLWVVANGVQD